MEPHDEMTFRPSEFLDARDRVLVEVPQEGPLAGSDQVMTDSHPRFSTRKTG
jgi:hypothetical protein